MIFNTEALVPDFVLIQDNTFRRNVKGKLWEVKTYNREMIYFEILTL